MRAEPSLTVISLGAASSLRSWRSWQAREPSTACRTAAIFADTRWEPPSVYEHIDWLEGQLSFPLSASWTTAEASART